MDNQNERRASTYIILAVILLLTLLLVYYALTAGDIKQLSVGVTSWELKSISNPEIYLISELPLFFSFTKR